MIPVRLLLCVLLGLPAAAAAEVTIDAYDSVGVQGQVRLRGRVFRSGGAAWVPRNEARPAPADNLGAFLTDELEDAPVQVRIGERTLEVRTDDQGFYEAVFEAVDLPPGVHQATVEVGGADGRHPFRLLTPGAGLTVISDFDDTIVHTGVLSKRALLQSVFLAGPASLRVVPGMAAFYRCLAAGTAERPSEQVGLHYLSASPVNLHRKIRAFLALHRFPEGPVHLRELELRTLRDSKAYKLARIEALAARFPEHRLLLIGDAGEQDPEVYREAQARLGDQILAIFIHRIPGAADYEGRFEGQVLFEDGRDAAREADRLGLLHPLCAAPHRP